MTHELLTPEEMAKADRLTIEAGPFSGMDLMRRAGAAVAAVVLERYPAASQVHVLCGPGNNGGDGYIVAKLLHEAGASVCVWTLGDPKPGTDAAIAAAECPVEAKPLAGFEPDSRFGDRRCAVRRRPVEGDRGRGCGRYREMRPSRTRR